MEQGGNQSSRRKDGGQDNTAGKSEKQNEFGERRGRMDRVRSFPTRKYIALEIEIVVTKERTP